MSLQVHIKKRLESFVLDVSLETDGGMLALLGASGCGKSMTLKCIAGIERPDEGRIVLGGRVLFDSAQHIDLPPQKRRVGYLFQQYALFPNMNVTQNLATAVRRLPKAAREAEIAEKIQAFHLDGLEKRRPGELSSGQQQRVALARILLSKPEVLLLDEPFSALDDALKWKLELELMELLDGYAGDVLFVSHSRDEVTRLCARVCVLTEGRSAPIGSVKELMRAPQTLSAAKLSGCKNFSPVELRLPACHSEEPATKNLSADKEKILRCAQNDKGAGFFCTDWGVTIQADGRSPSLQAANAAVDYIGIRAHSLRFTPAENAIDCTVDRVIDNVFSFIVMLKTPGGGLLRMEFDKETCAPPTADRVTVYVKPEDILLLRES